MVVVKFAPMQLHDFLKKTTIITIRPRSFSVINDKQRVLNIICTKASTKSLLLREIHNPTFLSYSPANFLLIGMLLTYQPFIILKKSILYLLLIFNPQIIHILQYMNMIVGSSFL